MKFVALISGGKDSFYSIMECTKNGHTLEALANLHPIDTSVGELHSFMFQTVGHDIIKYYRQCVDESIPLYKCAIKGKSRNVSLGYEITQNDEIEDLYEFLKGIKRLHPDIEGVSCGAILSHYQRTRVENVCYRLGLTCLAYLWQSDQSQLMLDMCLLGIDAIFMKVATVGLNEKHLGKLIREVYPILKKLNAMFDVHVCGEGGEFETLVLNAPFFVKKLRVKDQKVIDLSLDAFYLSLSVEVVDKKVEDYFYLKSPFPSLLLEEFKDLRKDFRESHDHLPIFSDASGVDYVVKPRIVRVRTKIYISNVSSRLETIEGQTEDILYQIRQILARNGSLFLQAQHLTVLLRNMSDFHEMNAAYESFFSEMYLPPSRVCVETTLPLSCQLQISCQASADRVPRSGIHIRSRSYWTPQNIGPYSQAIVESRGSWKIATLSGQIPLVPRSMEIDENLSLLTQSMLSLQHLRRVKSLAKVNRIASYICYITDKVPPSLVSELYKTYAYELENWEDSKNRLLILQVTALPRQAVVEWAGLTFAKDNEMYADDSDDERKPVHDLKAKLTAAFKIDTVPLSDLFFRKLVGNEINDLVNFLRNPSIGNTLVQVLADIKVIHKLSNMGITAEWMPVVNVYDSDGARYTYAIVWIS